MTDTISLEASCWWTLTRTFVLCLAAWPVIVLVERGLRQVATPQRPLVLTAILLPFLFPELLVGYTYRETALAHPKWAEWICAGLVFLRVITVGVVTLHASPASLIGPTALHNRWLLVRDHLTSRREWWQLWRCYWHGPVRRVQPALALMGLVAFQEFELAALLQTPSWTDWFITAQRLGLRQDEMLKRALWPVVMQLPIILLIMAGVSRRGRQSVVVSDEVERFRPARLGAFVTLYLAIAITFGCLIPLAMVVGNLPSGLKLLMRQSTQSLGLGREILIAGLVSLCTGLITWSAARMWTGQRSPRSARGTGTESTNVRPRQDMQGAGVGERLVCQGQGLRGLWIARQVLLVPGLLGSLLLSLATVVCFQSSWLRPVYDTPIPWGLALTVWLLPRAVLLRLWVESVSQTEAIHLAELLVNESLVTSGQDTEDARRARPAGSSRSSRDLLFRLRDQPRILAIGLLCYWAYLDLSTAYLLAPSGMPSGLVRLYNFMHFGRSAALSTEALLFFGAPVVAVLCIAQGLRMLKQ
ncbi:hypothetical protein [Schlesneria paludicola]|uniref:hypothetical protein n=1 Tax=Schlesneria paludicola TaxID=360056 RepID=UPI0002E6269F|nr:hypothetical protein [Schlesneria paludicola]